MGKVKSFFNSKIVKKDVGRADISYLERSIVLCNGQRCSRYEHKYDGF